jgi:hypothetical protein
MSGYDKSYNQIIKKKKRMGQSKIKKERDYKYPILSSMWPDIYIVRKKKGQDFIFFFHQTWEKNT